MNIIIALVIIFVLILFFVVVTAAVCKDDFIPNLIPKIGVCVAVIYLFASAAYTITLPHEEYVAESKQKACENIRCKL